MTNQNNNRVMNYEKVMAEVANVCNGNGITFRVDKSFRNEKEASSIELYMQNESSFAGQERITLCTELKRDEHEDVVDMLWVTNWGSTIRDQQATKAFAYLLSVACALQAKLNNG